MMWIGLVALIGHNILCLMKYSTGEYIVVEAIMWATIAICGAIKGARS